MFYFCVSSRAFSVSAPFTWNSLPAHIRSIDTLSSFKRHLKFHLFQSVFNVSSSCASASDSFSRCLAQYKFVCMYVFLYFNIGNGQPREPALCQLYRHTFVPYKGRDGGTCCTLPTEARRRHTYTTHLGQLSFASLRGRLIEYQLRLG